MCKYTSILFLVTATKIIIIIIVVEYHIGTIQVGIWFRIARFIYTSLYPSSIIIIIIVVIAAYKFEAKDRWGRKACKCKRWEG